MPRCDHGRPSIDINTGFACKTRYHQTFGIKHFNGAPGSEPCSEIKSPHSLNLYGVDDGARTHDDRNHNPGLYQLSYVHHNYLNICYLVRPGRIIPGSCPTPFRPCFARSKLLQAILYSGLLPYSFQAVLRTFKIAPGNFVEPATFGLEGRCSIRVSYRRNTTYYLVRLAGFEPATLGLEGRCSIRVSYRRRFINLFYIFISTITALIKEIWSG